MRSVQNSCMPCCPLFCLTLCSPGARRPSAFIDKPVARAPAQFKTWRTNRKYVCKPILRNAPLGGESERTFFAFFKPGCRKHTIHQALERKALLPNLHIVDTGYLDAEP